MNMCKASFHETTDCYILEHLNITIHSFRDAAVIIALSDGFHP